MNEHWERQWIIVCLGVVSIATIAMAAAVASVDLLNLPGNPEGDRGLLYAGVKLLLLFVEAATYLILVARARSAIFSPDTVLADLGIDRRRAVAGVYDFLFWQLYFLVGLLAVVVAERW